MEAKIPELTHKAFKKAPVDLERVHRLVVPKLLVLISTVSRKGIVNVSTAAWMTFLSSNPPILCLSLGNHRTLRNIKQTREFVINIPTADLAEKAFIVGELYSGKQIPFRTNKFPLANLTPTQSRFVRAPWVNECFAHLECKMWRTETIGTSTMVIAKVVSASAESRRFDRDNVIRPKYLNALLMVSTHLYTTNGKVEQLDTSRAEERAYQNALAQDKLENSSKY